MLNRPIFAAVLAATLLGTSAVSAQKLVKQDALKTVPAPVAT